MVDDYEHERFMRIALEEAQAALEAGDIPVGAVIVHGTDVVARGRNAIESREDDLHHAEHHAISQIPNFLWRHRRQCTLYSTLEPCALCVGAAVYSAIDRLVWGAPDPLCGTARMIESVPYYRKKRLVTFGGVLGEECQALLEEYVRRDPRRPYLSNSLARRSSTPHPDADMGPSPMLP